MSALVPRMSTAALTNSTVPYIVRLAELGLEQALGSTPELAAVNTRCGKLRHPGLVSATHA
jgi:alanine dehydrogenase